jgi:hypothetical protein
VALIVTTWLWGSKYGAGDLRKLAAGVKRHLKEPHRFLCLTDDLSREMVDGVDYRPIPDPHLLDRRGCLARLRMFDPQWQFIREIREGDRIVCMDLDSVVTGPLDPLFCRPETFLILQGANAANPCPFNGSLMMLRSGSHPEVWSEFSLEALESVPFHEFPDDQGWIWDRLPKASGWNAGSQSGVYAFQKPGWPAGEGLPADARLVVFPGWRSPEKFKHLSWVREHWHARAN